MGSISEQRNAIKIAVIEEQVVGLRTQQRMQYESTQKRFDHMDMKIDELTAVMNRGRGAYAASLMFAGTLGAALLKMVSLLIGYFGK